MNQKTLLFLLIINKKSSTGAKFVQIDSLNYMKTLNVNIADLDFVQREYDKNGILQRNRCGRDFIYYALNYYYKDKFNSKINNPVALEQSGLLGMKLPWWLMWTQLQFFRLPKFLKQNGLELIINKRIIDSFSALFFALSIPRSDKIQTKIKEVEEAIRDGYVAGIDISLGMGGLLDHVMFVYGYDDNNLYVCDTHQVEKLEYQKLTDDNRYYMKLPKSIIEKRWTMYGRVWKVRLK